MLNFIPSRSFLYTALDRIIFMHDIHMHYILFIQIEAKIVVTD